MEASRLRCLCALLLTGSQFIMGAETALYTALPNLEALRPKIQPGTLAVDQPDGNGLHILVIDGEDGVNIIKKKTAVKPVVEVRDRNNLPVAGVLVTFTAPSNGPSVMFANGSHVVTVFTDANGRAEALGARPSTAGHFQMHVSASYHSQTAELTITMTNVLNAAAASSASGASTGGGAGIGLSAATIGILAGVATGAAVALGVALSHHSSSNSVSITAGSGVTVGTPH